MTDYPCTYCGMRFPLDTPPAGIFLCPECSDIVEMYPSMMDEVKIKYALGRNL